DLFKNVKEKNKGRLNAFVQHFYRIGVYIASIVFTFIMIRKILIGLLVALVLIQFIRPARNNGSMSSANDITHYVKVPDTIMHMLKTSCYDCHSNHTQYPWYVNINPVGFWLRSHINDGKHAINFSDLSAFDKKKLDHRLGDIAETTAKHEMPLSTYTLIHTYAKLSDDQINMIKEWTDAARKEVGYQK
ncbi:MAG TPA: heme-binding domain-containing protein, partial [Chitinophagaceae bacterium]|nr:heme-binding domain-containing protein [Chitinophagaceae bacterium]